MILAKGLYLAVSSGGTAYPPDPNPAPGMETSAAKRFVYRTLSQSTAVVGALQTYHPLGTAAGTPIYESLAPQGSASPYLIIQVQSAGMEGNARGDAMGGVPLMAVKVVHDAQTFLPADTIMQTVLPLLEGASGTVTGFNVSCVRVAEIDYPEVREGKQYRHLGAVYQCFVENTT